MDGHVEIYTDGGSRGNPGPGACAFVYVSEGRMIAKGTRYLGNVTNNFAEYHGVVLALKYLSKKPEVLSLGTPIDFYLDSELVVRQLNGIYKTKNSVLKKINEEIIRMIVENKFQIIFKNIPRSKNKEADLLVNQELDKKHSL